MRYSPCVQSFSSAVYPFRRLTDSQVALFFRAEDGRTALLGFAKLSRSSRGVDINSKGTYRNGDRLYCIARMDSASGRTSLILFGITRPVGACLPGVRSDKATIEAHQRNAGAGKFRYGPAHALGPRPRETRNGQRKGNVVGELSSPRMQKKGAAPASRSARQWQEQSERQLSRHITRPVEQKRERSRAMRSRKRERKKSHSQTYKAKKREHNKPQTSSNPSVPTCRVYSDGHEAMDRRVTGTRIFV